MKKISNGAVFAVGALGWFLSTGACAAPRYEIADLGALLNANYSIASDINEAGQVTGNADGKLFVYDPSGVATVLSNGLTAQSINASGAIAGWDSTRGFVYSNGQLQWMNPLPGGTRSLARAINDSGLVAGASTDAKGRYHAVLMASNGQVRDLGVLAGRTDSSLSAVNNHGVAAGTGYSAFGEDWSMPNRAFWTTTSGLEALPLLAGGTTSSATGINDLGDIVGYGDNASGQFVGIVWHDGVPVEIPSTATTLGYDINNHGQVVGQVWVNSALLKGFLFDQGKMNYIDDLVGSEYLNGWAFDAAVGINDKGQITGYGHLHGEVRAYVLTPVPEPESLLMFVAGMACLLVCAQRRKVRR